MGKVWGIVEGKIVVEGESLPRLGEVVYDSSMREIGEVSSVFGKEGHFFIEITPRDGGGHRDGEPLYIIEERSAEKRRDTPSRRR